MSFAKLKPRGRLQAGPLNAEANDALSGRCARRVLEVEEVATEGKGVGSKPERHRLRAGLARLVLGIDRNVLIGNEAIDNLLDGRVFSRKRLDLLGGKRDGRTPMFGGNMLLLGLDRLHGQFFGCSLRCGAGNKKRARHCRGPGGKGTRSQ